MCVERWEEKLDGKHERYVIDLRQFKFIIIQDNLNLKCD